MRISHRHRRSSFTINYAEDITFATQLIAQDELEIVPIQITNNSLLNKNFSAIFNWNTRRLSFNIRGYNERRLFDLSTVTEEVRGVITNLRWTLGRKLNLSLIMR